MAFTTEGFNSDGVGGLYEERAAAAATWNLGTFSTVA
jgi:hypothetical protein